MDCRTFRDRHLAFVDHTMCDAELVGMQRHIAECEECARHDSAMRRGLLIFRNLPRVEPSADFVTRLNARLRTINQAEVQRGLLRGPGAGTFMAAAIGVVAFGFVAATSFDWTEPPRDMRLPPIVAARPEPPPRPPIANETFVASASTGVSVWSAALLVEQAPIHFVDAEIRPASWGR
jgi:hypothetical protein